MKRLICALAGIATLCFSAAQAAVVVRGGPLTDVDSVGVEYDPDSEGFESISSAAISVSTTSNTFVAVDFTRNNGTAPRFRNLTISIIDDQNTTLLSEALTDATGAGTSPTEFVVDLSNAVSFTIAFASDIDFLGGANGIGPDVNVFLSGTPNVIPVPAAFPFMISAIGGGAFFLRRKRRCA